MVQDQYSLFGLFNIFFPLRIILLFLLVLSRASKMYVSFCMHDYANSSHHLVPPLDIGALFHPKFINPFQQFKSNTLCTWTSIISISLGSICHVGLYFIPKGQTMLVPFFFGSLVFLWIGSQESALNNRLSSCEENITFLIVSQIQKEEFWNYMLQDFSN